ncbi:MAG: undecaprenyldiphospho-muramoylpentapeptide beta-N-acetylglucosaminyltransferase [Cytophagaceae bacterium]|nr:undecaprenyldiphospho-muramoylpentapeptide beta-N-acetylglucosaminyltransferase [Cytophagaceae bacterium]
MRQEKSPYRVIISGGGTGGHIYPAIAIANTLKELDSNIEILFVGAENRMEIQKVPAAGYKIEGLPISGLQRSLSISNLMFPFKVISSVIKAKRILKGFKPDIAVGVGGYASWPLLYAANSLNIPTLIQEQNSYAGVTNKLLAKKAKKICVAYDNMSAFFPVEKLINTGNPVRKDILDYKNKRDEAFKFFELDPAKKTILVIGGSLGARTINHSIADKLQMLIDNNVQLIWQTGKLYHETAKDIAAKTGNKGIKVFDFIYKMDLAYAAADVVISRAGALAISELCLVGKPAVFVPSPNVAEDHQTKNAMALVNADAAQMIKDEAAIQVLVPAALKLMKDEQKQNIFAANIKKLGKPEAAKTIANEVMSIIKEYRKEK